MTKKLRAIGPLLAVIEIGAAGVVWSGCGSSDDAGNTTRQQAEQQVEEGAKKAEEAVDEGVEKTKKGIEEAREEIEKSGNGSKKLDKAQEEAEKGIEEAKEQAEQYLP